jgi:hypothetical protein
MKLLSPPAAATIALLLSLVATPTGALEATQARYQVSYNGMSAPGSMSMRPQGGRWLVSLEMGNALASIDQATVFDVSSGRLRPLGSSRHVSTPLSRKAIVARFDWRAARATWSGDIKPARAGPVILQAGDVDPLLLNVALVRDALAGKPMRYRMLENGRARTLSYQRLGKVRMTVAGSSREAIKLFAASGSKQYVVWVVPGFGLPVRMIQHEAGGDTIDMRMQS